MLAKEVRSVDGTLTVIDDRTGQTYELAIENGAVRATDLRQIRVSDDDFGLLSYDPAFKNTANVRSEITYIDGHAGVLQHRGYPVERLAQDSDFLDVAHLLVHGELPDSGQYKKWVGEIAQHASVPHNLRQLIGSFNREAHPMGILVSAVGALSTFYPDAKNINDESIRYRQIIRLIAQMPTLAALGYRHAVGKPYIEPDPSLSFAGNFLNMMWPAGDSSYHADPVLVRALDTLFLLHADHEQNCSTTVMRTIGSSAADPYSAAAGAVAALYGPRHGGANEAVLSMLQEIGTVDRIPDYVVAVKRGQVRLMGFGHRVYRSYDPRAKVIRHLAHEVFKVTGQNPLLDIAVELERIALEDDYFVSRKLYPNVDFYSGLIYQAMGFPTPMFPVLFAIGRMPGWLAHWQENVVDPEQAITRPRQIYTGAKGPREFQRRSGQ